ncbi:magnesium transporter CorA family protein [Lactococcus taiwanensis]|jgi:magnesium transporter|uniref:Magnesium transporter CorA family protein n=1 Tax=Lactococcus taiwanensis TaxID=1151742 RepID=A0AA45QS11_9LACT|nr:magnesium transporter CorA family protein [Lactococcus taiwanensis]KZK39250.1 Magnesium and cobalt transport protein CorA [Lactococcus cremoris]QRZ10268.1 magnesium transporter CorA family protein [Lactococcus taiwanensis]QSE77370.1 magnesium transporter CorA family protein [Lactococcus taiwanensis]
MIKNYELSPDKKLISTSEMKNFTYVLNPTREEIGTVSEYYDFPFDYLSGILDDYENARFETDDNDNNLILLQYPAVSNYGEVATFPYSLVWTKNESVILALNHDIDNEALFSREYDTKRYKHQLIFQVMYQMTHTYHDYLRDFRIRRRKLEVGIKNSTKNDQIVDMIAIQASLIYFEDALHNNREVLQNFIDYLREDDEDGFAEKIYDIFVETDQAYTETKIQLKLLENLRDLFSNIVSNNLNIVMKIMTSATFVLGIPAVIVGFYGMNVPIPGQDLRWMVWAIFFVGILVCGWVTWLLHRKDML